HRTGRILVIVGTDSCSRGRNRSWASNPVRRRDGTLTAQDPRADTAVIDPWRADAARLGLRGCRATEASGWARNYRGTSEARRVGPAGSRNGPPGVAMDTTMLRSRTR